MVFSANIPYTFDEVWDQKYGRLPEAFGQFPINIVYGMLESQHSLYLPDTESFSISGEHAEMTYRTHLPSNFRVRVVINLSTGRTETIKYAGDELVCEASGWDLKTAMVQTTLVGLHPEEPTEAPVNSARKDGKEE
jgi:hypothetical protein